MSIDIDSVIKNLKEKRNIFYSEADFKHSLTWEIQLKYPQMKLFLEVPRLYKHIDIICKNNNEEIPIELKYKLLEFSITDNEDIFDLKSHGANDLGRYDFIKDITRIEKLIDNNNKSSEGYAIFLINDHKYWKRTRENTYDEEFKIFHEREITGTLHWSENASSGTKKSMKIV